MQSNSAPLALRQARQHLLEFGQCPSGLVNERLARSWSRSMAAGLAPDARVRPPDPVSNGSLRRALSASHVLLAHSRPIMEYVFDQVRHSQSVVVLADPAECTRIGQAGRRTVEQRYQIGAHVAAIQAFYEQVLSNKRTIN
mgnify:CR=1 FL=1